MYHSVSTICPNSFTMNRSILSLRLWGYLYDNIKNILSYIIIQNTQYPYLKYLYHSNFVVCLALHIVYIIMVQFNYFFGGGGWGKSELRINKITITNSIQLNIDWYSSSNWRFFEINVYHHQSSLVQNGRMYLYVKLVFRQGKM